MKKLISILLALMIVLSTFAGLSLPVFAEDADVLAVTVNGVTTNVKVGDTFNYVYTLADAKYICAEALVNYDSDFVAINDVSEDDEQAYDAYIEKTFPVVYDGAVCNTELNNRILYNFSVVDGIRFVGEKALASFEFTALNAGETTISTEMIELTDNNWVIYVKKTANGGELVKDYVHSEYVDYTPSEDETEPSEEPTEPSEEPTEPSEEPTEPSEEPTEPSEEPTEPSEEPTEPSEEPTEPSEDPTEPSEDPTEPSEDVKPVKVTNITTNPSDTNMGFKWDLVEDGFKYWVYMYNAETDTWTSKASSYADSAVVKLLDADTEYQFKVICKLNDGTMFSLSDADVITASTKKATATANIDGVADVVDAKITWDAIEGATKYWVYKATSEEGPFYIYSSAYETSLEIRKLRPDTDYYFKVVGLTENNGIPTISDVNASPTVHVKTLSGSLVKTTLGSYSANTATISWPQFKNADKYWMLYSTTSADTENKDHWTSLVSTTDVANRTYTFNKLTNNTTYYLTVCARYTTEEGEVRTVYYTPVEIRTLYSDQPFLSFAPVDETSLTVNLPEDLNVQKAWVYAFDENGEQKAIASTTTSSATLKFLGDYTKYTFKVQVLDKNGKYGYITPAAGEAYHN